MRRKKSICSTCLNSCHQDDLKDCDRYISFRQLSVQPPKKRDKAISEYTWADYGISMEQYRQLKSELEAGKYQQEASSRNDRSSSGIVYHQKCKNT